MTKSVIDTLREQSLEDVYNILCRNEPSKNSKKHNDWDYLESIAYEELLNEEERPNECTKIINEICDYLEKDRKQRGIVNIYLNVETDSE